MTVLMGGDSCLKGFGGFKLAYKKVACFHLDVIV